MRVMINGREFDVPTRSDGSVNSNAIRRAAGISGSRPLLMKNSDGSNQMVNPGEDVFAAPSQHFSDAPRHRRGG
jgi:hypothetical protein